MKPKGFHNLSESDGASWTLMPGPGGVCRAPGGLLAGHRFRKYMNTNVLGILQDISGILQDARDILQDAKST